MIDEKIDNNNDVIISSRIRLARNIADFPFISTCSDDQRNEIENAVRDGLMRDDQLSELTFVDSLELESLERQFLLDLQLITVPEPVAAENSDIEPEQATTDTVESKPATQESAALEPAVVDTLSSLDDVSLTVNEEDHLRITISRSDLDLESAWDQLCYLDDRIEQHLNYAFSPRWGYLTACPANVGTGMRVSVLVHLPALVMTGQLEKVFRTLQRLNVVARGAFGEGATGDFFRISNQATLGINESELIDQVSSVIPSLVKYEREARNFLLAENREGVRRDVTEALDELCKSDLDDPSEESNEQVMALLSKVRMGCGMGLLIQDDANRVNRLFGLVHLRHRLLAAVAREDYRQASELRDRIQRLEHGQWNEGRPT